MIHTCKTQYFYAIKILYKRYYKPYKSLKLSLFFCWYPQNFIIFFFMWCSVNLFWCSLYNQFYFLFDFLIQKTVSVAFTCISRWGVVFFFFIWLKAFELLSIHQKCSLRSFLKSLVIYLFISAAVSRISQ